MHRRINSFHSALSSRLVTVTVSCINQAVFSFPRSFFHGDCTREQRRLFILRTEFVIKIF